MCRYFLFVAFALVLVTSPHATATTCVTKEQNWRIEARRFLTKNDMPIAEEILNEHKFTRCIKMNNYVCMYQVKLNDPWKGSNGRHDCQISQESGHAVFSHAKFSIRSMVRDLCSKHKDGLRTAYKVLEKRTPWCDTLGSKKVVKGYARTCKGDSGSLSDSEIKERGLLRCDEPADGKKPSGSYCDACNCPDFSKADRLARGLDKFGIKSGNDDLKLFLSDGSLNRPVLGIYLSNIVADEIGGLRPTKELLESAFDISGNCKTKEP
jgi:hypothetical protein